METDHVESLGRSLLQHGPSNDRVYLMKLDRADLPNIIDHIHELAMRRGYSKIFANVLLHMLEDLVAKTGIKTSYTIARATSFGMNITFARNSYTFAGTLINNTQISGSLESVNIWHKQI